MLARWKIPIYLVVLALLEFGNDKSKAWLRCLRTGKSWSICIPYVYFWVAFTAAFWKHGNLSWLSVPSVRIMGRYSYYFHFKSMLGKRMHFIADRTHCEVKKTPHNQTQTHQQPKQKTNPKNTDKLIWHCLQLWMITEQRTCIKKENLYIKSLVGNCF